MPKVMPNAAASQRPLDGRAFREALGAFTTGVTVVTTHGEQGDVGLTANSFNSVSLDPPMVLWSLGKSASSLPAFKAAQHFAVHILSEDQQELSNRFATRGIDKFAGIPVTRGPDEVPLLNDCAARFVCRTEYQYEGGDHIIFVGEVLDFSHRDEAPLLFHGGKYGRIFRNQTEEVSERELALMDSSLSYLLRLCNHKLFTPVRGELASQGFNLTQYYFLAIIAKYGPKPLPRVLEMLSHGGAAPSEEDVDQMVRNGLIEERDGAVHLTQGGKRFHMEMMSFHKAHEARALEGMDADLQHYFRVGLIRMIEGADINKAQ